MFNMIKGLWKYRSFILGSIKREFQTKYRNSLLGAVWNVLNPLAMIVIYTVIFSQIMRAKLPGVDHSFAYSIYLCAGILSWGLFAEIISRSQVMFVDNGNLLKKINFPRICIPTIIVGSSLLNFFIVSFIFCVFLLISGFFPGWVILSLIPVIAVLIIFAVGLGLTIGVLNVFFSDVGQFFGIFLQFWFWLTPIVYSVTILPENFRGFIEYNPLAGVVMACQTVLVKGELPDWYGILPAAIIGVLLCIFGMRLFQKRAAEMVDEL
ncbi:ABC transporter permease [Serratia fonticola]|mgnify:CR=1 FL=1|uniref:ABC transporter permease n=1 Tax=Enterobacterales TaxID=91347 RepID=UPI0006662D4F|nr:MULTISPECIES: ABC transporter permease [Enterobacterales]MBC3380918.1 ABC transporter permease [Serratia fonticola]NYA40117.1 ABC transporter permease [Serratia fonticola]